MVNEKYIKKNLFHRTAKNENRKNPRSQGFLSVFVFYKYASKSAFPLLDPICY